MIEKKISRARKKKLGTRIQERIQAHSMREMWVKKSDSNCTFALSKRERETERECLFVCVCVCVCVWRTLKNFDGFWFFFEFISTLDFHIFFGIVYLCVVMVWCKQGSLKFFFLNFRRRHKHISQRKRKMSVAIVRRMKRLVNQQLTSNFNHIDIKPKSYTIVCASMQEFQNLKFFRETHTIL